MTKPKPLKDFEHQSLEDPDSISKYLEALCEGFRKGQLKFSAGERDLQLHPPGLLQLDVRARRKDGRAKVTVKVTWEEPWERPKEEEKLTIK